VAYPQFPYDAEVIQSADAAVVSEVPQDHAVVARDAAHPQFPYDAEVIQSADAAVVAEVPQDHADAARDAAHVEEQATSAQGVPIHGA
jgi:hypothetical protein